MRVKLKRLSDLLRQDGPWTVALPAGLALILVCLLLHTLNGKLRPVLETTAATKATNLMVQAIDIAVDNCLQENDMSYRDFVTLGTDTTGKVSSITTNTVANSRFKRQVVEAIIRQLGTMDSEELGYETQPRSDAIRRDIIQMIHLGSPGAVRRFCKGIQSGAPVDSYVTPEPWDMPGYDCPVIMAAGAFIQGPPLSCPPTPLCGSRTRFICRAG